MRSLFALLLVLCALAAGCGGDDGSSKGSDPPRTLDVASGGDYANVVVPAVEEVLSVRDDLPDEDNVDDEGTAEKVTELAEKIQRLSEEIATVTPPAEVLTNHQHLTDAVTIVEFDLRDVANPADKAAANASLDRTKGDLDNLESILGRVKGDLEKLE